MDLDEEKNFPDSIGVEGLPKRRVLLSSHEVQMDL